MTKPKYCDSCNTKLTKRDLEYNQDICLACAESYAEDADREMLGDDAIFFPDGVGDN